MANLATLTHDAYSALRFLPRRAQSLKHTACHQIHGIPTPASNVAFGCWPYPLILTCKVEAWAPPRQVKWEDALQLYRKQQVPTVKGRASREPWLLLRLSCFGF